MPMKVYQAWFTQTLVKHLSPTGAEKAHHNTYLWLNGEILRAISRDNDDAPWTYTNSLPWEKILKQDDEEDQSKPMIL